MKGIIDLRTASSFLKVTCSTTRNMLSKTRATTSHSLDHLSHRFKNKCAYTSRALTWMCRFEPSGSVGSYPPERTNTRCPSRSRPLKTRAKATKHSPLPDGPASASSLPRTSAWSKRYSRPGGRRGSCSKGTAIICKVDRCSEGEVGNQFTKANEPPFVQSEPGSQRGAKGGVS